MDLQTQAADIEEQLFRAGAGNEVIATWQRQEEARAGLHPRGKALSEDFEQMAMQTVFKLTVTECETGGTSDLLGLLEAGNLALSVLKDLDASLALGGAADDQTWRLELLRTCLAVSNLCRKLDVFRAPDPASCKWRQHLRICSKEGEVLRALGRSIWRPTAASWMRVFRTRLMVITRGDVARRWCDVSIQMLQEMLMTSPQVVRLPQRQLAAGIFARAAESLKLEQALTCSLPFATGLDAGALTRSRLQEGRRPQCSCHDASI
eukprot:TRINITY_DN11450_c1_g1_i1.p1 TRINITY_DN11450_c1_g1~~TRINITY_DN11450_c1_g1_i1.p1  ORF type:complete len:264 (-),score=56.52 TRINITY_DN11450_c1_g1_i1:130-921(-)